MRIIGRLITIAFAAVVVLVAFGAGGFAFLARKMPSYQDEIQAWVTAKLGITLDFAPVLDIFTNPKNTVIGDRALAERADEVARLGVAIIEELQRAGVAACGKHFPGHGDTLADSHHDLPIVEHDPDRLRAVEFVPFRAAIAADVASLMSCHVLVPAFDEQRPGTLSPAVVQGLLRDELGWDGLVFTDDMEMKAISSHYGLENSLPDAIAAGVDVLCLGNNLSYDPDITGKAAGILMRAVASGRLAESRINESCARVLALKRQANLIP